MLSDYYKILGVEPNADLITISKAFRQKAMNCHPDRGGSHAQMLLINEAWEVLSNSTLRTRYDEARREGNSAAAQEAAAADARSARGRAGSYPRKWADFEKWLEKNRLDFAGAEYAFHKNAWWPGLWPNAGKSVSGYAFIAIGGLLGPLTLTAELVYRHGLGDVVHGLSDLHSKAKTGIYFVPVLFLSYVGALTAAHFHRWIRCKIAISKNGLDVSATNHILRCENCGQKLRVPYSSSEILATCPACAHKFSCKPYEQLPRFPLRELMVIGLSIAFLLVLPKLAILFTSSVDREYAVAAARIMAAVTDHANEEDEATRELSPKRSAEAMFQAYEAAASAKDLPADGVTPALVNAVESWSDAEVAFYKARRTYYGDRTTEAAMQSAAKTAKARQEGIFETMSWGVLEVYNAEFKRVVHRHSS
jgi:hypothetical protein